MSVVSSYDSYEVIQKIGREKLPRYQKLLLCAADDQQRGDFIKLRIPHSPVLYKPGVSYLVGEANNKRNNINIWGASKKKQILPFYK